MTKRDERVQEILAVLRDYADNVNPEGSLVKLVKELGRLVGHRFPDDTEDK